MATVRPHTVDPGAAIRRFARTLLWAALAASCDALVADAYRGEPLATFSGSVGRADDGRQIERDDLRAAVFWSPTGTADGDLEALIEEPASSTPVELPGRFTVSLYAPPNASVQQAAADGGDGFWAIGRILLYADRDRDETRDADEPLLGSVSALGILYASAPLPAAAAPTGRTLPAGFAAALLPLPCGRGLPAATADGSCGVPLGARCTGDDDCGEGRCLQAEGFEWPDGACAIPEPPSGNCRPAGAALVTLLVDGATADFWVRACETTADCARNDHYTCDPAGACVPLSPLRLLLSASPAPLPFCAL